MTAGFSPTYQPQFQPQIQPQQFQSYGQPAMPYQNYGAPQPATQYSQTYTQASAQQPMPAQFQNSGYSPAQAQYQPQSYPQNYYLPQTPGIVNYVTPPAQNMQNAPQGQPQALSHIPYEVNPLNMNSGYNPAAMPQYGMNSGMNAQMPAPDMQNAQGQGAAMNAQAPIEQPFLDVGVVNAPENFSKTPIIDDLNRRGQETPRETPPKLRGKKTLTAGNISAALSLGSLGIILTMGLCKILKFIKHK